MTADGDRLGPRRSYLPPRSTSPVRDPGAPRGLSAFLAGSAMVGWLLVAAASGSADAVPLTVSMRGLRHRGLPGGRGPRSGSCRPTRSLRDPGPDLGYRRCRYPPTPQSATPVSPPSDHHRGNATASTRHWRAHGPDRVHGPRRSAGRRRDCTGGHRVSQPFRARWCCTARPLDGRGFGHS